MYINAPELAVEILQELKEWKFQIELVLADSLYGESGDVIHELQRLKLFIVAIRGNHGVLAPGQKCYNQAAGIYSSVVSSSAGNTLYSRALSLAKFVHFVTTRISKTNYNLDPWFIMTNLPKSWQLELGNAIVFEVGLVWL